jgi:glyoxylase-like metal-dependent hydrolase (beta-lactamase superfamily II)
VIVGDALINFEPHGFDLLPPKYCTNQKRMIRSLRRLLDLDFKRIFFAHGNPIVTRARDRLASLLP